MDVHGGSGIDQLGIAAMTWEGGALIVKGLIVFKGVCLAPQTPRKVEEALS